MTKRMLRAAVVALIALLLPPSAFAVYEGGWQVLGISTLDYTTWPEPYDQVDGRIYENDGTTLVADGSLVQIIIARAGAEIVDPLEHFDDPLNGGNNNGVIDGVELSSLAAWVQAGADPADISGGANVLSNMAGEIGGEHATSGGAVNVSYPVGFETSVPYGFAHDKIAWRAWNLSKEDLLKWCDLENHPEMLGVELWYTDGREYFTHDNAGGGPDTGWWVGMPDMGPDGDVSTWAGFVSPLGAEIYAYCMYEEETARSENRLDHYLGTCIPEPGTMLPIGGGFLLLAARRARNRSRAAAE